MISRRSLQPELIDLGPSHYTEEEYSDCLNKLGRIGRYLGGDRATFQAFNTLESPPESILDVGCGGGTFTLRLAKRYPNTTIVGIDISPAAIAFATEALAQATPPLPNVSFLVPETPELNFPDHSFDVVTATLVCHHLSDDTLISFLKKACRTAKKRVIINDLHRHPLALIAFGAIALILFRNRLIWHDGLLSIRRAFTRDDWWKYLDAAGIARNCCTVTWHWAFRWIVNINTATLEKHD